MPRSLTPALLCAGVLVLTWLALLPGLHGTFLFDDFNNLNALGAYGPVDNWRTFTYYITSGEADPTGRPLALLSFLLDANDWPAAAEPFKYTNILLHLLNGALLIGVLLRLGRRAGLADSHAQYAAVLGGSLWMLHPLFVSTTLYVIQREAMLPATFVLAGMLAWDSGCLRFIQGRRSGPVLMLTGAWGCTLLAVLGKGNGILLPLLLAVTEWVLPVPTPPAQAARALRRLRAVLLWLPSAAILAWLVAGIPGDIAGARFGRPWTLGQRLISEPRAICDYLKMLWLPRSGLAGLFYDSYPASTDLLHPWTTLPALVLVGLAVGAGLMLRQRHRPLAFALLFYFTGQLLESTVIPLELFFEHRNYLPAMPMFWPLAIWLTDPSSALPRLRRILAPGVPILLALLTFERATIWGAPYDQALLWAAASPDSARAQVNAAQYERAHGRPDLAVRRLSLALEQHPREEQLALNLIDAQCALGQVGPDTLESARNALAQGPAQGEFVSNWFEQSVMLAASGRCVGFDLRTLDTLQAAVKSNPRLSAGSHQTDIDIVDGRIALAAGRPDAALKAFDAALKRKPTPDLALTQAAAFGAAGFPRQGLAHLEYFKTLQVRWPGARGMKALHRRLLLRDGYWNTDLARIEQQLRADAATAPNPAAPVTGQP